MNATPWQEAGWAPEPVRTFRRTGKLLSPAGIRSTDHRARSQLAIKSHTADPQILGATGQCPILTCGRYIRNKIYVVSGWKLCVFPKTWIFRERFSWKSLIYNFTKTPVQWKPRRCACRDGYTEGHDVAYRRFSLLSRRRLKRFWGSRIYNRPTSWTGFKTLWLN